MTDQPKWPDCRDLVQLASTLAVDAALVDPTQRPHIAVQAVRRLMVTCGKPFPEGEAFDKFLESTFRATRRVMFAERNQIKIVKEVPDA